MKLATDTIPSQLRSAFLAVAVMLALIASAGAATLYQVDIDSTQGGTSVATEDGWSSLNVGEGGTGTVTIDGTTFETFSADGSRNRNFANNLTRDFIFDDGAGQASGVRVFNLPPGLWQAEVWAYDSGSAAGTQIVGITRFGAGNETIYTDAFESNPDTPFAFTFDTADVPDGFGIFTRENNDADRGRFNAVRLTQIPEPGVGLFLALAASGVAVFRRRNRG